MDFLYLNFGEFFEILIQTVNYMEFSCIFSNRILKYVNFSKIMEKMQIEFRTIPAGMDIGWSKIKKEPQLRRFCF